MPGNQGLINIARGEAQRGESNAALAQDQAVSDRESSPNHRLPVTKAHPSTYGVTKAPALPTDAP